MTAYAAPLADMRFALDEVAGLGEIAALPGYEEAAPELVDAVLEQAGKLAGEVLAPLNQVGDRQGSVLENGVVRTPEGFAAAYKYYVEGGWNALPFDPAHGGQGLPWSLAFCTMEMWNAANLGFALCPLLNQSAVELLQAHGSAAQKRLFLDKMVSGQWTGTMNLTEPQAGTDLGALKTRALRTKGEDGGDHYKISGQKIFITYGEHDWTENIVHMVLARTPDAPPGSKGISLFIVPKFQVRPDGTLGPRNDLRCASLEHKLGIHASPTAVMLYGENGGAVGHLVGEENRGIEYMFTMMNSARLAVGVQGVAIAERAYQRARAYARERRQGPALGDGSGEPVPILRHPDVRRMLMTMKAQTEAMRALACRAGAALDHAKRQPDEMLRARAQALLGLLTPVCKAWFSDTGCEIASIALQVHGGMGYIEETGAAQHLRDARITPIYEGTNGVQAMDLLLRKLGRDKGEAMGLFYDELREIRDTLGWLPGDDLRAIRGSLDEAMTALDGATDWLLATVADDPVRAATGATPYLRLAGIVAGGAMLAKEAAAAARRLADGKVAPYGRDFLVAKLVTARFYADNILPQAQAHGLAVTRGAESTLALEENLL